MTMTCACVTDEHNEIVATCATHLRAFADPPPEPGRAPRRNERVCELEDVVNAPYLGRMTYCRFQQGHRGPHSWIDDPMGPRHPEESEYQYRLLRDNARCLGLPFEDPRATPAWQARFPYQSEAQRAADYAQRRAEQRNRP